MTDAVELAQRLAALLESGRRVATYKLATLLALIDTCAEAEQPPASSQPFPVSILELADRVIDLYWPQVRPYYDLGTLRQSTQHKAIVLDAVAELRSREASPAAVRAEYPSTYHRSRRRVAHTLAKQPLPALQTLGSTGRVRTPFLYDDSWLSYGITLQELERREWQLHLLPGVADGLVRLAGLLRPAIERAWTDDVASLNGVDREYQDLPLFLFGADRSSLVRAGRALLELEGATCFYCGSTIRHSDMNVDHFLPWARVPFNRLANLVLADVRCNTSKSDALASLQHLERWRNRDKAALEVVGADIRWPAEWDRSQRLARGLYGRLPAGTPLWSASGAYELTA
ncbi:MAG: HNH endonuclease signature motif containing protein [Mycobacteriales bacterium]